MSIRNINKIQELVITDTTTGQMRKIKLEQEYDSKIINAIIESITEDNIKNRLGYNVTFMSNL